MEYLKPLEKKLNIILDDDIVTAVWLLVNSDKDALSLLINMLLRTHLHKVIKDNDKFANDI